MADKLSLRNRKPLRHKFGVLNDIADMPNLNRNTKIFLSTIVNLEN